ncbi:Na+/H+ antiporter NhaC [Flavobacteriaceae bacterium]|jgi:Na+:H+ antiporter, NhaC family|nr:Na+/H+ antiporter NhaC [Flavobacteriaceae bacterium]MDB4148225.1 Na+/H+ antiporter NhaC [Flavobacteriaceae bacterium]MDB4164377.1 Na+/H+ antiporter NhaC [Flavobacteriaceae bacterium]MDB9853337.1 Na+/H+ antiporter NhaC [Flavobacteriaceae bacterium]MDC1396323.1 Na+/H+ antiporter NhaC [Flavobacteriaceae bacterium]|tara:strand:+ start:1784 stop:3247 length:1464 start_codon:yes stop_codon:yes gene_type:complete
MTKTDETIHEKINISLKESLFPIILLIMFLSFNVYVYGDDAMGGSNQFILLVGAAAGIALGIYKGFKFSNMMNQVAENLKSVTGAIVILLFVGALSGTWLISGIIPSMIYYGLKILHPSIFLPACLIICAIISIATGSSWTTSATVGIALIGISKAIGIPVEMSAGAIISGAYFGDKLSPLSDTTNLAPAISGSDLFTHIKYLTITTIPTITISLIIFIILNFYMVSSGPTDNTVLLEAISQTFNITPLIFIVPLIVIILIIKKTPPIIALFTGTIMGAIFALIFQQDILIQLSNSNSLTFEGAYSAIVNSITVDTNIESGNSELNDLFKSGGMIGMMNTIWLVISAMVFGGVMESIGALKTITTSLLNLGKSTFSLFASTAGSCLAINLTTSDQYLAIVIPGKMFEKAFKEKNLAPENLSRTLEDTGTVTSVLIPWNSCGAYQSGVLGVSVLDYFFYAIFNWLSFFMTLIVAGLNYKIKKLDINAS